MHSELRIGLPMLLVHVECTGAGTKWTTTYGEMFEQEIEISEDEELNYWKGWWEITLEKIKKHKR